MPNKISKINLDWIKIRRLKIILLIILCLCFIVTFVGAAEEQDIAGIRDNEDLDSYGPSTSEGGSYTALAAEALQCSEQQKLYDLRYALSFSRSGEVWRNGTTLCETFLSLIHDGGNLTFEKDLTPGVTPTFKRVKSIEETNSSGWPSAKYTANNEGLLEQVREHILKTRGEIDQGQPVPVTFLILPLTTWTGPLCKTWANKEADPYSILNVRIGRISALEVTVCIEKFLDRIFVHAFNIAPRFLAEGEFSETELFNLGVQLALMFIHFTVRHGSEDTTGSGFGAYNQSKLIAIEKAKQSIQSYTGISPRARKFLEDGMNSL